MNLTLLDRLVLSGLIPKDKTTYEDIIIGKDITKKVEITQDDLTKYEIKQAENGGLQWKQNDDTFDYEFTEAEKALVKRLLTAKNEAKEMSVDLIGLYKLFVA